ncbi:hypothetical protein LG201_03580 [Methylobacillus gramineus]|uniref:hypothetical protein n=1 Tax=Methylobacillus gramineus TaxID=755169 RepID=UPI001CFFAB45|nr:hypothetical protein [Methylobacillus gramineus]MCB5184280.1 hypothetical protein [Methylobacillus gramineus]
MKWHEVESNWKEFVGGVNQKLGKITSVQLEIMAENKTYLSNRMQDLCGPYPGHYSKKDLHQKLDEADDTSESALTQSKH